MRQYHGLEAFRAGGRTLESVPGSLRGWWRKRLIPIPGRRLLDKRYGRTMLDALPAFARHLGVPMAGAAAPVQAAGVAP